VWKVHPVIIWSLSFFDQGVVRRLWAVTMQGCMKFLAAPESMNAERGIRSSCRQTGMWNDSVDLDDNAETTVDSWESYFTCMVESTLVARIEVSSHSPKNPLPQSYPYPLWS